MQLYAAYCGRKVEIRQKEWTINDSAWGHDPKDIKFGHVEGRGGNGRLYAVITGITRLNYAFFYRKDRQTIDSTFSIAHSPACFRVI